MGLQHGRGIGAYRGVLALEGIVKSFRDPSRKYTMEMPKSSQSS